jgi:lysophospholipase L1-like esterase
VHAISRYYRIECIDLYGIRKDLAHPNAKGQNDIARQVIEVLKADFNV